MIQKENKILVEFLTCVTKLSIMEVFSLVKILGISFEYEEEKSSAEDAVVDGVRDTVEGATAKKNFKPAEVLIEECIAAFGAMPRGKRRKLLGSLRKKVKGRTQAPLFEESTFARPQSNAAQDQSPVPSDNLSAAEVSPTKTGDES